jgi:hypothetical protein
LVPDERYDGKPLLRFLDSYVLDAIGELGQATRSQLEELAPDIARILGVQPGGWQAVVEQAMELPSDSVHQIGELWKDYQRQAHLAGQPVIPIAFAQILVDSQFGYGEARAEGAE